MSGLNAEFNTGPNKKPATFSAALASTGAMFGKASSSFASAAEANSKPPGSLLGRIVVHRVSVRGSAPRQPIPTGFGMGKVGPTATSTAGFGSGIATTGAGGGLGSGKLPSTSNGTGFPANPGGTSTGELRHLNDPWVWKYQFRVPTKHLIFRSGSAFKSTSSFGFNSSANSRSQERNAYPNLSISHTPADLKYAELQLKAFGMTQEHNVAADTLVADLPQDAKNIFSQIETCGAMGPSLGYVASDCDEMGDSPLAIEDKLAILLRELKNFKLKLQKDDAVARKRNADLEADKLNAKKVQQKLLQLKAQKGAAPNPQGLNPLGNVPFTQLINPYAYGRPYGCNGPSFSSSAADSAYDGQEYFMQLHASLQTQFTTLKSELQVKASPPTPYTFQRIQTAMDTAVDEPPSQVKMDELVEKTFALSRREMSIRTRLFSALHAANLRYPVRNQPPEPKDILKLGELFQPHYVPKANQDDVLFEIANVECKPADLSKLKPCLRSAPLGLCSTEEVGKVAPG
ncbi:hypothetical protein L0F63_000351 [Massospora cicadina]|nr:hypothetical protein L0F63_000351 [Massospora cicadina]